MTNDIKEVVFDSERHTYTYRGRRLLGVTDAIGRSLGKSFPDNERVRLASMYGSTVHEEVERCINERKCDFTTKATQFVLDTLKERFPCHVLSAEVMVSDFDSTASKVDVVAVSPDGEGAVLFDIKTTRNFDREYCTRQLNVYRVLYEMTYRIDVKSLYVIQTKDCFLYPIALRDSGTVDYIFKMNREALGGTGRSEE